MESSKAGKIFSKGNVFKIVKTDTVTTPTYTVTGGLADWHVYSSAIPPSVSVPHNVTGKKPVVFASIINLTSQSESAAIQLPYFNFGGMSGTGCVFESIVVSVTDTNVEILEQTITNGNVNTLTRGGTTIKYYICQEVQASDV